MPVHAEIAASLAEEALAERVRQLKEAADDEAQRGIECFIQPVSAAAKSAENIASCSVRSGNEGTWRMCGEPRMVAEL
eukprot:1866803-Rhodomonas_salina.1